MLEDVELLVAEGLFLRVNLDAPARVAHIHELAFAHVAMGGDAPGDFDVLAFLELTGDVFGPRLPAAERGRELVFEGVNALLTELRETGLALCDQRIRV